MKNFKRYLAVILSAILLLVPICNASSADVPHTKFAVLGDSIASGYGLNNIHDCYGALISAEKSYYLTNDAVPGHTTLNLLNVVCNSEDARTSIAQADLIAVSIGGNDLIQLMQESKNDTSVMLDIILNGVNAKIVKETKEKLEFNLKGVCTELRTLNPDAPIIFQTLYNPLYANEQYGAFAAFAEEFVPIMDEVMNYLRDNHENIFIADVYSAFDAYYKETGSYDVIQSDGIHPSEKGHMLIAEVLTQKINELEKAGLVPAPTSSYYLLGDADHNEKINIKDATTIQKVVAGILTYSDKVTELCLDTNRDGNINIKDATAIQKWIAGLDTNSQIGSYLPYYGK